MNLRAILRLTLVSRTYVRFSPRAQHSNAIPISDKQAVQLRTISPNAFQRTNYNNYLYEFSYFIACTKYFLIKIKSVKILITFFDFCKHEHKAILKILSFNRWYDSLLKIRNDNSIFKSINSFVKEVEFASFLKK